MGGQQQGPIGGQHGWLTVPQEIAREAPKPMVSFEPHWNKIFRGESVMLTCNVAASEERYARYIWYKDGYNINKYTKYLNIFKAKDKDAGKYQCMKNNDKSNAAELHVSNAWVTLQVPINIFEGDDLHLRCHSWPFDPYTVTNIIFYKDKETVSSYNTENVFVINRGFNNGMYGCAMDLKFAVFSDIYKDWTYLSVQELFSHPAIKVSSYQMREGSNMTVSCHTSLNVLRESTELQTAFYKNAKLVKEFSFSNEHQIIFAQLEDSGDYTCEVTTLQNTVRKMSKTLPIRIQVEHPSGVTVYLQPRDGLLIEGQRLEVTCSVTKGTGLMEFSWCNQYKRGCQLQQVHSQQHIFVISNITENYDGQYFCAVKRVRFQQQSKSESVRITVKVQVSKPTLMINLSEVAIGDDVDFVCLSDRGSLPIHYQFYHMGLVVRNITVNQKGGAHLRLNIANVKVAGLYYCDSHNDISNSSLSNEVTLSIIVPVAHAMITVKNGTLDVKAQDSMTFNCSVELGTSPNFMWFHNKEEVDERSGLYQITEMGKVLHVKSVQLQHGGTYQCQASNMVSPNRIFTTQSNILTVTVLGVSGTLHGILTPSLSVSLLVLLLICGFLLFNYRRKTAQSSNCSFSQQQAGKEIPKSRNHQEHEHEDTLSQGCTVTEDQEEYYNLNPRDVTMNNSVCYTYIDVKCGKKVAVQSDDKKAGYSVTYSAVKCEAKVTTNSACNKELPDPSDSIYENFNSK